MTSKIQSNSSPYEKWQCTTAINFQKKTISNNEIYAHNILDFSVVFNKTSQKISESMALSTCMPL